MSTWVAMRDEETSPARAARPDRSGSRVTPASRRGLNGEIDAAKTIDQLPAAAVDAVRELLTTLQQRHEQALPAKLGFTSALAGEGVTFVSRTVAAVLAHDFRQRVCLVDLNWGGRGDTERRRRRRRGHERRNGDAPEPLPGLADTLRRELSRRDEPADGDDRRRETRRAIAVRDVAFETGDPRLTFVPAGSATTAEAQVFARSEQLSQIIGTLARQHDRLILDLPPVLASSAALPLARQANAVGVVLRHGVTTEAQVRAVIERMDEIQIAGVILNRTSSKIPGPLRRRLANW